MQATDIAFTSALEQARLVRTKEVSPVELVEAYGARIEELNPKLNAYVTTCLDRALDQARTAEATASDAPFHGVPISIKDLLATEGVRTTYGSRVYAEYIPQADDAPVRRMREAGFIVLGKTNTPEFGTTPWTEPQAYGPSRNPWDLERTPGGSSGGAAAAVAAGMCAVAQGSDGGGSIRIPSSCCGVYGIKPSRGRVSPAPNPASLLSQNGPIARTVADAAALLDVLAGDETGDAWWAPPPARPFVEEASREPGRLRIAWTVTNPGSVEPAPGNRAGTEAAAALLAELGHDVAEDAPEWGDAVTNAFITIWAVQQASREPAVPVDDLDPSTAAWSRWRAASPARTTRRRGRASIATRAAWWRSSTATTSSSRRRWRRRRRASASTSWTATRCTSSWPRAGSSPTRRSGTRRDSPRFPSRCTGTATACRWASSSSDGPRTRRR
jgi:amidase